MKAAAFYECGGPEKIQIIEVPRPVIGKDQVLVRVRACALNHLDLWQLHGPAGEGDVFPFWGGADVAGIVAETGQDVSGFQPGERVLVNPSLYCGKCEHCVAGEESLCVSYGILGARQPGGLAEYVAVSPDSLVRLPDELPFEQAAAVPLVFQTAWRAVITRAAVRLGEDVLVLGASGGVSTAAIQIAKLAGARVMGVTSGPENSRRARELGADQVFDRLEGDYWVDIRRFTGGRGVDVIIDSTGAVNWNGCLENLVKGGRLVTYGRTTGRMAETNISLVFWNQLQIIGSTMSNRREFNRVIQLIFEGKLHPVVDSVFPFTQVRQAYERLENSGQFGKIVIRIEEGL
jgi:NADPH:quinone reductase-like Zn-dependent oxidoreductase